MTTPTDTEKLAQALRELLDSHDHAIECDFEDQRAADERECTARAAARELLAAHESSAQPASVDEIAMHLACEHGDTDDAATGYSFTMEQFDAFVHAFVRAIRSDLPAQPASVQIFEAYKTWPADIRRKLSAHDLRRMTGWTPNKYLDGWEIDTSTGTPILTHGKCSVIQDDEALYVMGLIEKAAQPASVAEQPLPMETAPRDGTMVRLLVDFTEHATEDTAGPAWTIGANNDDNVGDDEREGWKFAGWCWTHDHFTQGEGTPVGWLPMLAAAPQPPAKPVCNRDCDCVGECKAGVE